jgi:predicted house-cleaning noncanonical NTP pyrophosphatase (MazG superfamily)
MSEQAPGNNNRLKNFDANKLAHEEALLAERAQRERDEFDRHLYGKAGTSDFSDKARKRVTEADAYEKHLQELAEASAGTEETMPSESDALRRQENALSEAFQANPQLRRIDLLSQQIHELKDKQVDEASAIRDSDRLINLENKLNEMLVEYSESPEYDENIADMLRDRSDTAARQTAGINALSGLRLKKYVEKAPDVIEEDEQNEDEDEDDTLPSPSETDTREIPRRRGARVRGLARVAFKNLVYRPLQKVTGPIMGDYIPNDTRKISSKPVRSMAGKLHGRANTTRDDSWPWFADRRR